MRNLFYIGLLMAGLISPTFAGDKVGNGGDAVKKEGELIPRDLIPSGPGSAFIPLPLSKKKEFLNNLPGFMNLIKNIGQAHPGLALAIWDDLMNAKIYLVDWELDVLPRAETSISSDFHADRQVCIRTENEIICSLPALNESKEQRVYPIHESLHSMIRGEGPIKHEKVRAMTRYLIENEEHYSFEDLQEIMNTLGVYNELTGYYWSMIKKVHRKSGWFYEREREIVDILFQEMGSNEARCALYKEVINSWSTREYPLFNSIELQKVIEKGFDHWANYDQCPNDERFSYMNALVPTWNDSYVLVNKASWVSHSYVYPLSIWEAEETEDRCNTYANDTLGEWLKQEKVQLEQIKTDLIPALKHRLQEESEAGDPATAEYLNYVALNKGWIEKVDIALENVNNALSTFEKNQKICQDHKEKSSRGFLGWLKFW
ncbi:MAG: hypothetical protein A2Z91_07100 [Deltaproteobacteria bacterium GWA2_38_16]|nr:MAG: hypothetical protein A2Z91_07100 [Deltaproteobacteria bacterium GWA2_38_16]OGQ02363.1 MAG: hypothetical protein A3D19_05925 [Deltaproteobacteria bacterium RIFCSPHIGHO2_02_FULL_38_15]OGQ34441.1 MAG: hypothetical protein A3A72_01000 [Deltaproteobacteria bacterium RIFCSPLOWO2_01_FULL_38_9]OGQ63797.1 MAG: hypothetical protein A3G92_06715 [Deltaproteobacteria bacterium RIFCSPLOWO2_12_FULL_38_8]HBQ20696.1 hypothetical protein [Deltaproteobacteria bacterium]